MHQGSGHRHDTTRALERSDGDTRCMYVCRHAGRQIVRQVDRSAGK